MKYYFLLLTAGLLCWFFSLPGGNPDSLFFFWREQLMLLSGVLLITSMAFLIMLAVKVPLMDQLAGGLDRRYHLHKWIGITAGCLVLLHWMLNESPGWLSAAGLLELPARKGHHGGGGGFQLMGLGKELGSYAFYAMMAMIVFSLIRTVPYRIFRLAHKLMPVIFTVGAIHGLIMLTRQDGFTVFDAFVAFICIAGTGFSIWSLAGRNGDSQQQHATVQNVRQVAGQSASVTLKLEKTGRFEAYRPGQFAYLKTRHLAGFCPFTVLNFDPERQEIEFGIKGLGVKTRTLADNLKAGEQVVIEGPYGAFTVPDESGQQIWLAAGIGITPFIAWMSALAATGQQRSRARLIYCVRSREQAPFLERVEALADRTGVELVVAESSAGRISAADIRAQNPEGVWFCGPLKMRKQLMKELAPLPFHYERFEFR